MLIDYEGFARPPTTKRTRRSTEEKPPECEQQLEWLKEALAQYKKLLKTYSLIQ